MGFRWFSTINQTLFPNAQCFSCPIFMRVGVDQLQGFVVPVVTNNHQNVFVWGKNWIPPDYAVASIQSRTFGHVTLIVALWREILTSHFPTIRSQQAHSFMELARECPKSNYLWTRSQFHVTQKNRSSSSDWIYNRKELLKRLHASGSCFYAHPWFYSQDGVYFPHFDIHRRSPSCLGIALVQMWHMPRLHLRSGWG